MVELETGKKRVLLVRDQSDFPEFHQNKNANVEIVSLDQPKEGQNGSYGARWLDLVNRAREPMLSGRIAPTPGEPCDRCVYGELCRRSAQFSEDTLFTEEITNELGGKDDDA